MKILVLTSGGDAPGMNRFIYDLYSQFKKDLFFAYAGFTGLVNGQIFPFSEVADKRKKNEAGTVAKSSRCPEFKEDETFEIGLKQAKQFDVVIILGGNGSEKGANRLYENGVNTIFVPATIDNDVEECAFSIGFLTAVKEGVYAVENSMPSIQAFSNSCLFEVMGRDCSNIAKKVGEQVSADLVICDKKDLKFEEVKNLILKNYLKNESTCIVVRENIMNAQKIADKLNGMLEMNLVKVHIVGRTQRGGKPTKDELALAAKYAKETIRCIKQQVFGVRILADEQKNIMVKSF